MKKLMLIVAAIMIIATVLFDYQNGKSDTTEKQIFSVVKEIDKDGRILCDDETGVLYYEYNDLAQSGLTVMMNSDGSALLKNSTKIDNIEFIQLDRIKDGNTLYIVYYEKQTGVKYIKKTGVRNVSLTIMLDADGKPQIYNK